MGYNAYPGEIFTNQFINLAKSQNQTNILTHWSLAQVLMMKKTGGQKSCWNVPLNRIWKSHMTRRGIIPREIDSTQYDTPESLTRRGIIPQGDSEKFE